MKPGLLNILCLELNQTFLSYTLDKKPVLRSSRNNCNLQNNMHYATIFDSIFHYITNVVKFEDDDKIDLDNTQTPFIAGILAKYSFTELPGNVNVVSKEIIAQSTPQRNNIPISLTRSNHVEVDAKSTNVEVFEAVKSTNNKLNFFTDPQKYDSEPSCDQNILRRSSDEVDRIIAEYEFELKNNKSNV